ncbi:MAG: molybdate ABC transporter substrate-binding protein [Acidimicrobiales bacterium]
MRRTACTVLLVAALGLVACREDTSPMGPADDLTGTVTVLAATSLTDAVADIAEAFETEHGDVDVALTFDGSAKLATAIIEGAPADVFASADEANLAKVTDAGLAERAGSAFATNQLQIVVAAGNPLGITGLDDLTGDVVLSLCAVEVPCGSYAAKAFERAGLAAPAAGQEENVRGVLSRVQLGEADAGIVYVTDVLAAEGVEGVDLAADEQVEASYPAAALTDGPNPEAAAAFVAFLMGEEAQTILADYGFGPP